MAKVNIDENKDLAERYGVESLPTLKWFEGGEALVTYNEEPTKENVNKWINKIIKGYSKELKSADDVKRKEVAVVAVFKQETTEENDEIRSAFRRRKLILSFPFKYKFDSCTPLQFWISITNSNFWYNTIAPVTPRSPHQLAFISCAAFC